MKALIWLKENSLKIMNVKIPNIDFNEVLIKVKYAGICGSDITVLEGKHISAKPPVILGHEFSGVIEKTNSKKFRVRDRVVVEPLISCGECYACISGSTHICKNLKLIGIHQDGGFAEFVKVPENTIFKLPKELSLIEGVLVEPLSVAIHSIDMSEMKFGDNVLVTGAGPIGILCGILARHFGANRVIITDISEFRLSIAKRFGMICFNPIKNDSLYTFINEITNACGINTVFECTGLPKVVESALQCLAIKGTLVQVGIGKKNINIDMRPIAYKEQKIVGVRIYAQGDFQRSINFLANKKGNLLEIVTQTFKLQNIKEAFELSKNKEKSLKVLIEV